jgi:hypothetical protein
MTVRTSEQYYSVARTKEAYSDGSAHVEWFNTEDGTGSASLKYWKAYADSKAETGEAIPDERRPSKAPLGACPQEQHIVRTFS